MLAWFAIAALAQDPVVEGFVDWQGHPAMHETWRFFDAGLTERTPRRTWRHQFKQVAYGPYVRASGARLVLAAAMAAERARDRQHAQALVEASFAAVEAYVAANAEVAALARTPAEARHLLATTDKQVFVHSIEGGHLLLESAADARAFADRGVALVTVLHLRDDELGGSALRPDALGPLINRAGARARRRGEGRGLTERGAAAIVELADAGILVDLSHMSPQTFADALEVTAAHGIPPVLTHGQLTAIRDSERGVTDAQLVEVYRQGGSFNLGLSGRSLGPRDPSVALPDEVCWGTLDAFAVHHRHAVDVLAGAVTVIFDDPALTVDTLTADQQIALAVGWSSDWNGWVSHSEPTARCRTEPEPLPIDRLGLAHPGLLPQHWQRLEEHGLDLAPIRRSPEQFLRLWEQVRR